MDDEVSPTDSRCRPDQRLMEEGAWDEANKVKVLLEEKQRAARRKREQESAEAAATGNQRTIVDLASTFNGQLHALRIAYFCMVYLILKLSCFLGKEYQGWEPRWFKKEKDPQTGNLMHIYTGDYWQCKDKSEWTRCPDIYLS